MFAIKISRSLNTWQSLSERYLEFNYYYEQQPLEYAVEDFYISSFPINYNMSWWRLNNSANSSRLNDFSLSSMVT